MFMISKIAAAVISPLGAALLGGLLALLAGVFGRQRWAFGFGALALAWLWCWSLPTASYAIRGYLEEQHPAIDASAMPKAGAIVVLGGGTAPLNYGASYPNLGSASDREWHAARLFHAGKAPMLILSGGHDPEFSASSSAESMRHFIGALGVPDAAMVLEVRSLNTTQNARFTADILEREGIRRILLVTSALHMARSIALFEAQGLEVVPAATDHEITPLPSWRKWLPDTNALDGSSRAMKEIVGRWVGR